jgi:hypothetical protein
MFRVVLQLRSQSGFGWDETTLRVTATSEVWDAYIKVCRTLAPYFATR